MTIIIIIISIINIIIIITIIIIIKNPKHRHQVSPQVLEQRAPWDVRGRSRPRCWEDLLWRNAIVHMP